MTQTLAIFHDAYRSLNAKKMFWTVLALSVLVVTAFAFMSINERGVKVVFWQLDSDWFNSKSVSSAVLYKFLFVNIGVGVWLSWAATILALISTAGIFPDLITSGAVGLLVSKPISRLRLFFTQYVAGLLFVTLQVGAFSLASFLLIGIRGGAWEPGLFLAVPLVVCFFSYLFSVCVLFGLLTRSTLTSLLMTLLFWFAVYGVGATESFLLMFRTMDRHGVTWEDVQRRPDSAKKPKEGQVQAAEKPPVEKPAGTAPERDAQKYSKSLVLAHDISYAVKTVLPKTTETMGLLERSLIRAAELPRPTREVDPKQARVGREMAQTLRGRSVGWIVGTSLLFELAVLSAAAFVFCRRDY